MMRYVFIVIFFVVNETTIPKEQNHYILYPECEILVLSPYMERLCCKSLSEIQNKEVAEVCEYTESKYVDGNWSCAEATCLLEKNHLFIKNREIDEDKLIAMWEKITDNKPELKIMTDRIRAMCFKGKYKDYPSADCEPLQLKICIHMNGMLECPSWRNEDPVCRVVSYSVRKCKSTFVIVERRVQLEHYQLKMKKNASH